MLNFKLVRFCSLRDTTMSIQGTKFYNMLTNATNSSTITSNF